jgi:formate hydrogenlyase subunit 4
MSPTVLLWVKCIVNIAIVLAFAPLLEGIARKVTALIQSRQGPPIAQPYFDLLKLLGKEDIESGEVPWMQRFASYLALGTFLSIALLVPMGTNAPLTSSSDSILLIYLLTLSGISTLLAGFAAGSTYSVMGVSREMMTMLTLEPLFAIAVVVGTAHAGSLRLDAVLNGSVYGTSALPLAGLIMLGVLLFSLQAFVGRLPFDVSEAETEIMEGPVMEYSGPKLAMFKYARMVRLLVYCGLFVALFVPWGNIGVYPVRLLIFLGKVFVLVLLVTVIAATHARYRIDQVIRYYALLLCVALLAAVVAANGW